MALAQSADYNRPLMRASRYFLPTLREVPADATVASHRLLLRGGFIRQQSAGVYNYLPLGLRVIEKIKSILRQECAKANCVELLMPTLVPFELLEETGRDKVEVLFPTTDRTGRRFALGFTHEEIITDIARNYLHSYRDLPITLYQIQTKFRDEPRPRAGLIRGKEFIMLDAYSFDPDDAHCDVSYDRMWHAFDEMFRRLGLETLVCEAEAGDIGGGRNHEFMVITEAGEDSVLRDDKTGIAANAERCDIGGNYSTVGHDGIPAAELVATPNARSVKEVTSLLAVDSHRLIKTLLVRAGDRNVAALVRGDRDLNPHKLARRLGVERVAMMESSDVQRITGADVGFAGPIGLSGVEIIADNELQAQNGYVVGGNVNDKHFVNACHGRDFKVDRWEDIRVALDGDPAVSGGVLREVRGIEVGHIFQLGTKYSGSMKAHFDDGEGKEKPIVMGCYGLGVSRSLQAVVEVYNDEAGIIWPMSIAPFEVVVIVANAEDESQMKAGEKIYFDLLEQGVDVLLDDRSERAGAKFKDADLIGYPLRVVCGRGIPEGKAEVKWRHEERGEDMPLEELGSKVTNWVQNERTKSA